MQQQASTKPSQDDELLRGMEAARRLIGFFPIGAASDPKIFEAGLCQLLAGYPQWVLDALCNVRSGLPAHHTFLPSIAEIRQYCEKLLESERRHRETIERWKTPKLPPPIDRSNRPTYDELKAKYGPNWGIGQPADYDKRMADAKRLGDVADELLRKTWDDFDREFGA